MWKTFLALVAHRLFLFIVALLAINYRISQPVEGKFFRPLKTFSVLFDDFSNRISNTPDIQLIVELRGKPFSDVFQATNNPLIWITHLLDRFLSLTPTLIMILLSNLVLFMFLWELQALVGRLAIPEVGTGTAILMVLWVTSYELTLGSSLGVPCLLLTMAVRHAIDDRWFVTGLGLALLGIFEPFAVFVLPILLFYFWQFQRHLPGAQIARNLLYFLVPTAAVVAWRWSIFQSLPGSIHGSALFNVIGLIQNPGELSWALSKSFLGQTITLGIFLVGAVSALVLNTSFLFRVIPTFTLMIVLMSSSYGALASRLMLAGTCLGGIGAMSSTFLIKLVQIALLILGATEVVVLFSS